MTTKSIPDLKKHISDLQNAEEKIKAFYEKWIDKLPFENQITKILVAGLLLSSITFILHASVSYIAGEGLPTDYSFLLAVMHGLSLIVVAYATHKLKRYCVELSELAQGENMPEGEYINNFIVYVEKKVHGYALLPWGIVFGTLNTGVGYLFGNYYQNSHWMLSFSLHAQHFLIGILCGMAVGGIYTILLVTHRVSKIELKFNFYHADRCGGTSVIGNLLFTFSLVTLLMGVFISFYITNTNWTNGGESNSEFPFFTQIIYHGWIAWPFIVSILVFAFPILKIHGKLKKYKTFKVSEVRKKLQEANERILNLNHEDDKEINQAGGLIAYSQKLSEIDEKISKMNSWPYNREQRQAFFSLFPITTIVSNFVEDLIRLPN